MAGPLSGVGAQQQLPINTATQPGVADNTQVRESEQDQDPQENTVQAPGTAPAETQNTETGNADLLQARIDQELSGGDNGDPAEQRRGSIVDITV